MSFDRLEAQTCPVPGGGGARRFFRPMIKSGDTCATPKELFPAKEESILCKALATISQQDEPQMGFTNFKDRIWKSYDWTARQLFKLPPSVTRAGFSSFGGILWLGWVVPKSPVSRTFRALADVTGRETPRKLFRQFVSGFTLTL